MFVPTNPNPTDILGRTYFDCENLIFVDFVGFQIPRCPGSEISRFADAAPGTGTGRTLRSQLEPSPNAPRDQIRRKEPKAIAATDNLGITCRIIDVHGNHALFVVVVHFQPSSPAGSQLTFSRDTTAKRALRSQPEPVLNTPLKESHSVFGQCCRQAPSSFSPSPNGAGRFFPTNKNLADILRDTDFDFENLYFIF